MHVLVTGASGKVGRRVLPALQRHFEITVFDLQPPPPGARFIRGDILDPAALHFAMRDADAVLHLAAIPAPGGVPDDTIFQTNVTGTYRVCEAAALGPPKRLVFASSESTYGMSFGSGLIGPAYLPIDEDHPTRPRDVYGLSKVLGEEICRRFTRRYGLQTVCLRYPWVFWDEHYRQLPEWQRRPRDFMTTMWSYIDVRDLARAYIAALTADIDDHQTILVTARRNYMNRPTLQLVRQFYGEVQVRDPAYFEDLPDRCPFRCDKAQALLGWQPEHDWQDEVDAIA